ncbi:Epsin-2, partial [Parelaphostrongylus tenuis]
AFSGIMLIIWKRSSDPGRNWRHVYKGLVLFDFSIKCEDYKHRKISSIGRIIGIRV